MTRNQFVKVLSEYTMNCKATDYVEVYDITTDMSSQFGILVDYDTRSEDKFYVFAYHYCTMGKNEVGFIGGLTYEEARERLRQEVH